MKTENSLSAFLREQDVLYNQLMAIEPLTKKNISKKDIRILIVLYTMYLSDEHHYVHADIQQIKKEIMYLFKKQYSLGDILSFIETLCLHEYVHKDDKTSTELLYGITSKGLDFLKIMRDKVPTYFDESQTPNTSGLPQEELH